MSTAADRFARRLASSGGPAQPFASVSVLTVRPAYNAPRPDVFAPPTDVYETTNSVTIRMEIAGADPAEISIVLDPEGRRLSVRGSRRDPASGSSRRYHNMEIQCGDFSRDIELPVRVDAEATAAKYEDGFLVIYMPKCPSCPPRNRQIEIG